VITAILPEAVIICTAAVSTSPASPMPLSTSALPSACTVDEILADEEAGHVEIVDHHVAEQPARAGDVADRRRRRIARDDGDELDVADLATANPLLQRREIRVEAPVEADHQRHAGLFHHRQQCFDALDSRATPAFRRGWPCRPAPPARSGRHACRWG
jgi:hypothetical protein